MNQPFANPDKAQAPPGGNPRTEAADVAADCARTDAVARVVARELLRHLKRRGLIRHDHRIARVLADIDRRREQRGEGPPAALPRHVLAHVEYVAAPEVAELIAAALVEGVGAFAKRHFLGGQFAEERKQ